MKLRNGFVSNSSSSSFILTTEKSVLEYAIKMVKVRNDDSDYWDNGLLENLEELMQDKDYDPDTSISFNTCNYETYIKRIDDYVYITTCNNHSFYDTLCDFTAKPSEKILMKIFGEVPDEIDYGLSELHIMGEYFFPELGITASHPKRQDRDYVCAEFCEVCWHFVYQIGDKKFCPKCHPEILEGIKTNRCENETAFEIYWKNATEYSNITPLLKEGLKEIAKEAWMVASSQKKD